jgi:hypothetical protein
MKTEVIQITPGLASAILAHHNKKNPRRINRSSRDQYALDMSAGRWELTHQGIAFDGESIINPGNLIDGQTRLDAVVAAGVTIPFHCFFLANRANKIDYGRKRTSALVTGLTREQIAACYAVFNSIATNTTNIADVETLSRKFPSLVDLVLSDARKVCLLTVAQVYAAFGVAYLSGILEAKIWYKMLMEDAVNLPQPLRYLRNQIIIGTPEHFRSGTNEGKKSYGYCMALKCIYEARLGNQINKSYPSVTRDSIHLYDGPVGAFVRDEMGIGNK